MSSLRLRIVVLGALMALGSAAICAIAAVQVANRNIIVMEDRQAKDELSGFRHRLAQVLETLAFEVDDYGNWDELYAQMPSPETAWARVNLTPGKVRGALTQFFITAEHERITGRYQNGEVRGASASTADPASPAALLGLLGTAATTTQSGIAILSGHPALYAVTPVRRSDRLGEAHGFLIAIAYLDAAVLTRLEGDGWSLHLEPRPGRTVLDAAAVGQQIQRDLHRLRTTTSIAADDGSLLVTLSTSRDISQRIADETAWAIIVTGLVVAVAATLLGTWLGWRWVAPISALAAACRAQAYDAHVPLPTVSGLLEADLLTENLRQLILRLRIGQDELAHALDRETTINAIHRRFLTQLGHEFGPPIRRIIALCAKVERQAGRLTPDEVASARQLADELEQRFQEILGQVAPEADQLAGNQPLQLDHYLNGLADLLRPQAELAGMTIRVDAPATAVPLDPSLLNPALINLCANAIRSGHRDGLVLLQATLDEARAAIMFTVKDNGPGLPDGLGERLRQIFASGEVLPGTPGIGMGLTLVLANVRALGGSLLLANQSEPGVTIVIRLPLARNMASSTASERIRRRG